MIKNMYLFHWRTQFLIARMANKHLLKVYWASQVAQVVNNPPANAEDIRDSGLIPGLERSPGGGHGNPLKYSCLENPKDRGAWVDTVHGVTKRQAELKQFNTHIHKYITCYQQGQVKMSSTILYLLVHIKKQKHFIWFSLICLRIIINSF